MGLSTYTPKTETVEFPGGEFSCRGLALEDLTVLLRDHYEPISALFDKYVAEGAAMAADQATMGGVAGLGDMRVVIQDGLDIAPGLIADVIARAADEPEYAHSARKLPTGKQIEAVEKIVRLTLEAEGGLEKLVESVTKLAATVAGVAGDRSP